MDRIHPGAAINETVAAFKVVKQPRWLIGFVNGILRNIVREKQKGTLPEDNMPTAVEVSHPEWIVNRWQERYGHDQALQILQKNNCQAPLCLQVNTDLISRQDLTKKLSQAEIPTEQTAYAPDGLVVPHYSGSITDLPGYNAGLFQVQDEAAQLAVLLLAPFEPGNWLDSCAGLGGKTTQLARLLPTDCSLIAVEPNRMRVKRLEENCARMRLANRLKIVGSSLEMFQQDNKDLFDRILVDAPCSGLGVIRRRPDLRWNRTEKDLKQFQKKQLFLLETAAAMTAANGIVAYITCSTEPEENERVVEKFLSHHPEFSLENAKTALPASAAALVDDDGFFRTIPNEKGLDGFFGARLVKSNDGT